MLTAKLFPDFQPGRLTTLLINAAIFGVLWSAVAEPTVLQVEPPTVQRIESVVYFLDDMLYDLAAS